MLKILTIPDTVKTLIDLDACLELCGGQPKRVSSPFPQKYFTLFPSEQPCAYAFDIIWLRRRPYEKTMIGKSVFEELRKTGTRSIIL